MTIKISKDRLWSLYITKNYSIRRVAGKCDVSAPTIRKLLDVYHIPLKVRKYVTRPAKSELYKSYIVEGCSMIQISKRLGTNYNTISGWLKYYDIPLKKLESIKKDITGKKFGRLVALRKIEKHYVNDPYRGAWLCSCVCGKEKIISLSSLVQGTTQSCDCLHRDKVYKGYKDLGGQQWSRIRHQAKIRGLSFLINIEYVWDLYLEQNKLCALSGLPIELKANYKGKESNNTASLDRIDSTKGYEEGNIQWVHKVINIMKNKLPEQEFRYYCSKVCGHLDS